MTELETAYREIHALTHAACLTCPNEAGRLPHRCCDPTACANAAKWAALKGVTLKTTGHPTLPFMALDNSGCTIALAHKPLCTMHACVDQGAEYHRLRVRIAELEGDDWLRYLSTF